MKDLFIRRVYTHKGVSVAVDIDLIKKTVSLVEKQGGSFHNKNWVFAGRELQYMAGWQLILDAMSYAIGQATTVLEEVEKRDQEEFTDMMLALDHPALRGKK